MGSNRSAVCAVGAETLYHVVDGVHLETLGKLHLRDFGVAEAEGAVAAFAVEVGVLVVGGALVVPLADLVAQGAAAVLDGVDEMVVEQEGEGAEDGAALCRGHALFQFAQGERSACAFQLLEDEQAHGGELHPAML